MKLTNITHRHPLRRKRVAVAIKTVSGYTVVRAGHSIEVTEKVYQENKEKITFEEDPAKWIKAIQFLGTKPEEDIPESKDEGEETSDPKDEGKETSDSENEGEEISDSENEEEPSGSKEEEEEEAPASEELIREVLEKLNTARTHKQIDDIISFYGLEKPEGFESMKVQEKVEAFNANKATMLPQE